MNLYDKSGAVVAQGEDIYYSHELRGWVSPGAWLVCDPGQSLTTASKVVGPIAFQLLFTAQERVKAKELRAADPFLDDFWRILDDPRTDMVDLSLASTQEAVEYTLTAVKAAGVVVDVAARKAEMLTGRVR
jgi:hypothetical protein